MKIFTSEVTFVLRQQAFNLKTIKSRGHLHVSKWNKEEATKLRKIVIIIV